MAQGKVEGLPEDIAEAIQTLQKTYAVVNQGDPQKLTGAGERAIVYQYIVVRVIPFTKTL